jgi:hypothetical protein
MVILETREIHSVTQFCKIVAMVEVCLRRRESRHSTRRQSLSDNSYVECYCPAGQFL